MRQKRFQKTIKKFFLHLPFQKATIQWRDYKQEALIKQGREQFKTLLKKGLRVPVVLL